MEINLTEIEFIPLKPRQGLLAFVSFIINNAFFVGDVAIYSRLNKEGFRLSYPTRILKNGLKVDCFHPISRTVAESIEKQVIKAFLALTQKSKMMQGSCNDEYSSKREKYFC